jgi:hypothetical protein
MKIEPIKSLFTKGKMSKDCFENYPVKATDYPKLTKAMDAALAESNYSPSKAHYNTSKWFRSR